MKVLNSQDYFKKIKESSSVSPIFLITRFFLEKKENKTAFETKNSAFMQIKYIVDVCHHRISFLSQGHFFLAIRLTFTRNRPLFCCLYASTMFIQVSPNTLFF